MKRKGSSNDCIFQIHERLIFKNQSPDQDKQNQTASYYFWLNINGAHCYKIKPGIFLHKNSILEEKTSVNYALMELRNKLSEDELSKNETITMQAKKPRHPWGKLEISQILFSLWSTTYFTFESTVLLQKVIRLFGE